MPPTNKSTVILLTHPSELDGEPAEVAAACIEQAYRAAKTLAAYIEATVVQVRNAELTAYLEAEPALDPEQLAGRLDESLVVAACDRAARLADTLPGRLSDIAHIANGEV
jgi:hypothetical protein